MASSDAETDSKPIIIIIIIITYIAVFRALASANSSIVSVKSRLRSSSCSMLIAPACLAFPAPFRTAALL